MRGCTRVSEGCRNCYAETIAARFSDPGQPFHGFAERTANGPRWTGNVALIEDRLTLPLRWRKPARVFVNSAFDLFHESVPDAWIDRVFAVMALAPHHTFQLLSKRSKRMRDSVARIGKSIDILERHARSFGRSLKWDVPSDLPSPLAGKTVGLVGWPLPNVWLGVSAERQQEADERIPDLLATPAAVRFVSVEPMLGAIDLRWIAEPNEEKDGVIDALLGCNWIDGHGFGQEFRPVRPGHVGRLMTRHVCSSDAEILANQKLSWVIVGGESGPGARPMHPAWAQSIRDQCAAAGVPFFMKQLWGTNGRAIKDMALFSEDLRIREFPNVSR